MPLLVKQRCMCYYMCDVWNVQCIVRVVNNTLALSVSYVMRDENKIDWNEMKSNYSSRKTFQLFQNSIDPDHDGHIPISPLCYIRHSSFHGDSPSSCPQTISEYVAVDLSGFLLPCFFLFLSNCFFLSFFPSFFLSFYLSFFTFFFVCPSLLFYHSLVRILFICFLH